MVFEKPFKCWECGGRLLLHISYPNRWPWEGFCPECGPSGAFSEIQMDQLRDAFIDEPQLSCMDQSGLLIEAYHRFYEA